MVIFDAVIIATINQNPRRGEAFAHEIYRFLEKLKNFRRQCFALPRC